ncbi:PspC domain-containing protein [Terricaulis sp.]|uniref:PspC domain-containing protein n=1 Tax=Terricaulis sp. TaxID=2768686 RepID=UPI003784834F
MERVVTVNLNGRSYQLDESAETALRAYLTRAEAALADNPDKAEIRRDLEQAIADKCASYLGPHKNVVSAAEMTTILTEMGPVEGDNAANPGGPEDTARASAASGARRRLYRIKDGAVVSGVCAGLGAYFDLDANLIRFGFVLLSLISGGWFILAYVAMMFLVPSAHTSEEWAAAHGVPFNAQEVIDRAKREYSQFTGGDTSRSWRAQMRAQRRAWKQHMRDWGRGWDQSWYGPAPGPEAMQPVGYVTRVFAGLFAFVFSIVTAALFIAFLIALFSLLQTGAVMGWAPPADMPIWLAIVILCIAYAAISSPFSAMRRSSYATVRGYRYGWRGGGDGFVTFLLVVLAVWLAYLYVPAAHTMIENIPASIENFFDHLETNY